MSYNALVRSRVAAATFPLFLKGRWQVAEKRMTDQRSLPAAYDTRNWKELAFREVYDVMARHGMADALDSAEFRRVYAAWLSAGMTTPIAAFIAAAANKPPPAAETRSEKPKGKS